MLCFSDSPVKLRDLRFDRFCVVKVLGQHRRSVQRLFVAFGHESVTFDQDNAKFPYYDG